MPSRRFGSCLALALLAIAAVRSARPASAAPDDAQRPKQAEVPSSRADRKAADAEHQRALAAFDAWCTSLEQAHRAAPDDGELVWRVARCYRLRGQAKPAEELVRAARARVGDKALRTARAAVDARIGANEPAGGDPLDARWRTACEHFAASLALDPSPTAQLAVAACNLDGGQLIAARTLVGQAMQTLEPLAATDEYRAQQLALARWLSAELERVGPRVIVRVPADTSVHLDDQAIAPASETSLEPGRHVLRAERTRETSEHVLDARGGQTWRLQLGASARQLGSARKIALWTMGGVGAASAVTSIVMFAYAQNEWDGLSRLGCSRSSRFGGGIDCSTSVPDDAPRAYLRSINLFQGTAAGAVLLGAGALVVYLTAPSRKQLTLTPVANEAGAGLAAAGVF